MGYEVFHRDVAVVVAFYEQALGFVVTEGSTDEHAVLVRDSVRVGCSRFETATTTPRRPPHGSEVVLRVDDVGGEHDRVVASGHRVADPLQDRPWGLRDFRLFDPTGQYLRVTSS